MLRLGLATITLLTLSGCATPERCSDRQFFKPKSGAGVDTSNRYFPHQAVLQVDEDATLHVSVCSNADATFICIAVYPAEGVPFRFSNPRVTVSNDSNRARIELPITGITYSVNCRRALGELDGNCESSTESPLPESGNLEKTARVRSFHSGSVYYYADGYAFSPNTAFKGATVSVMLNRFRRKYEAISESFQPSKTDAFHVSLPKVQVGERTRDVPQVEFKLVSENVCLPNRPLSLQ